MIKRPLHFSKEFIKIFAEKRLTRGAAALSYYLTMTFFPLIICLYTLLGNNYDRALQLLNISKDVMAYESYEAIGEFLLYVSENNNQAMMIASIILMLTTSSAAIRSVQLTIGDMQGGQRFKGLPFIGASVIFSVAFVVAIYISILLILGEDRIINNINNWFPFITVSDSWGITRFILMAGIDVAIMIGLFEMSKRRADHYTTLPGAVVASLALAGVGFIFSRFIGASVRYPLVYGSLAALILLMLWLYISCIVILCGAAINIAYRNVRMSRAVENGN